MLTELRRKSPTVQIPLHLLATLGVTLLLMLVAATFAWQTYRDTQRILLTTSTEATRYIRDGLSEKVRRILTPARNQISQMEFSGLPEAGSLVDRLKVLPLVQNTLLENPITDALFVGYANGEFILFRRLRDGVQPNAIAVPARATLMVQSISRAASGVMLGEYLFYDRSLKQLEARSMPDYRYDPRTRPWYQSAAKSTGTILTEPYVFFTTKTVGATMAERIPNGVAIVGLDLTLESITAELKDIRMTPSSELVLIGQSEQVVAYKDSSKMTIHQGDDALRLASAEKSPGAASADGALRLVTIDELDVPPLRSASSLIGSAKSHDQVDLDGRKWQVTKSKIPIESNYFLTMLVAIPEDELFEGAREVVMRQISIAAAILLVSVVLGWIGTRMLVKPLNRLARETKAIAAFDFEKDVKVTSVISEVGDLSRSLGRMKVTIRKFLDIGHALAAEPEFRPLLDLVLREAIALVECDGGAIYLWHDQEAELCPEVVRWNSETVARQHVQARPLPIEGQGILGEIGTALRDGRIAVIQRRLEFDELDALGLHELVERENAISLALVVVPLFTRKQEVLGALILVKVIRAGERAGSVSNRLIELIRAVSGSASVAIENKQLLLARKKLMDALIKLIAGAIDAKSAYTAGHCSRVPVLTRQLAEAACAQTAGPLADFNLSADEWEAVDIASWLHDCGKVTTPEYIVDKATKLETLYDRIHEIRMRFEVLKRDAEIAYWRGRLAGGDEAELKAEMDAAHRRLDEEFAFVATCNEGGEVMEASKIERIKAIAAQRWRRTLSNRIGLSYEESRRMSRSPEVALPVEETLLADRDDHITPLGPRDMIAPDNPWGFRLALPKYRMNRGEIYNLCIGRGTLTEEERYLINDHISQTIIMLQSLPFPQHLRAVPEIAGGHHEKMDGTGYPKRLKRAEMSPVARMMAIADVFEALTAADRPYKKAKKLSEAIKIMAFMKRDNHLDPDLLDLFLREGVWKRYAERFLLPEQIDEPDIDFVLGMRPVA
jgi:HD-GYP domain-containing protein (c-di-GMP phosphodiesterase class II)/HAMP domain-containing protein